MSGDPILPQRCPGTQPRRAFLRSGLTGLWSLGLADLLQYQSAAAAPLSSGAPPAVLVLWLWGGPSHLETFDPKPDAPSEYRGEFNAIGTNVPGMRISEHLPGLARFADRYALIRTLHHDSPGHVNSTHTVLTGYRGEEVEVAPYKPKYPDAWTAAARLVGDWTRKVPPFVALPSTRYTGGAYLGSGYDPLLVTGDPSAASFRPPDVVVRDDLRPRISRRAALLERFDRARRTVDESAEVEALDGFQQRALSLLTSDATARAFDLQSEGTPTRERYGMDPVGQRCLLARRLIEAGCRIVTVDFPCVPGQKAFSWDDHASVWNIFEQMKIRLPVLDRVVCAMIQDLYDRGLADHVLLLVMGEMGRTPKISHFNGQPGREHWSRAMSALVAGGGMRMGQVIGETNPRGEEPAERPVTPNDLLATFYRHLRIPLETQFTDHSGRPVALLPSGDPIAELL